MAVFSDGTTDITIKFVDEQITPIIERATKTSAGGRLKSQSTGERLQLRLRIYGTGAQQRSLFNLLTNGANEYYYTTEDTHTLYSNVTFPLNVIIDNIGWEFDNRSNYVLTATVTSVDYI